VLLGDGCCFGSRLLISHLTPHWEYASDVRTSMSLDHRVLLMMFSRMIMGLEMIEMRRNKEQGVTIDAFIFHAHS
jgi:hypothetical protein